MAQHFLDRSQVRPAPQEMRGEGMPQHVRMERLSDAGRRRPFFELLPKSHAREWFAAVTEKKITRLCGIFLPFYLYIETNGLNGPAVDGNNSLLSPLAEGTDEADVHVQLFFLQLDELGDTKPGGIHEFQHGLHTDGVFAPIVQVSEKTSDLLVIEIMRQPVDDFRGGHAEGWVLRDKPLPVEVAVELLDGFRRAVKGGRFEVLGTPFPQEFGDFGVGNAEGIRAATTDILQVAANIRTVCLKGVGRQAFFHPKVRQEVVEDGRSRHGADREKSAFMGARAPGRLLAGCLGRFRLLDGFGSPVPHDVLLAQRFFQFIRHVGGVAQKFEGVALCSWHFSISSFLVTFFFCLFTFNFYTGVLS